MLRCNDCQMTFETSSMLERHQQKYCDQVATPILLGRYKVKELEEMKKKKQMLRRLQDREESALVHKLKATSKDMFHDKDRSGFVERADASYRLLKNLGAKNDFHADSQRETMSQIDASNSRNSGAYSRNVLSEAEIYSSDRWHSDDSLPSRRHTGSYFNINQLRRQGRLLEEQNEKIQRKLRQIREEKEENDLSFRFVNSPSSPSPPPSGHYAVYSPRKPITTQFPKDNKKSGIPRWRGLKTDNEFSNAYQFAGRKGYNVSSSSSQGQFYQRRTSNQNRYKKPAPEYNFPHRKHEKPVDPIPESGSSDSLDSYARDSADENLESSSVFNPLPRSKRQSSLAPKPPLAKGKRAGYPYKQINERDNSRLSRASQQKQIDDVIKIINDQKSRSEILLEDLKKQIDQIQTVQQRQLQAQAERISSASGGASLPGFNSHLNGNLRKLKTTNSLVDEIKFMKDDYLQSGGNDRQVLEDMDNLLRDAFDLDKDKGRSHIRDTASRHQDLSEKRRLQQMEDENRRLNEELQRLRAGARRTSIYETPDALPYY